MRDFPVPQCLTMVQPCFGALYAGNQVSGHSAARTARQAVYAVLVAGVAGGAQKSGYASMLSAKNPQVEIAAASRAYGSWVLTWSIWSVAEAIDATTVVSLMGEA